jgi:hypothetical protein
VSESEMKKFGLLQALITSKKDKSRKICFFYLRGGLGNQLFQIISLINRSLAEDFDIVFCDQDVRKNPRDKNGALGLKLTYSVIDSDTEIMQSSRLLNHILRGFRSQRISCLRMPIINLDQSETLPLSKHFIASGFLQEKLEFLDSPNFDRPLNLSKFANFPKPPARVAIHIRGTDSLSKSEMALTENYYMLALEILTIPRNTDIDVYSDDIQYAKNLCAGIRGYKFNYVEEQVTLNSLELLANISSYENIVCSKSTLAWWAAIFGEKSDLKSIVASPWSNHLHQITWKSVSENLS